MKIQSIKYTQNHYGRKWAVSKIDLDSINLIVGKNASGKSSTIRVIRTLADLISGETTTDNILYNSADYEVSFIENEDIYTYILEYNEGVVIKEILKQNQTILIDRKGNTGHIFYQKLNQMLDFETESGSLAISRKDSAQHPYLVGIQNWGKNLNHYVFSTAMGQNVPLSENEKRTKRISLKNSKFVADMFSFGNDNEEYIKNVISDINAIDYNIESISIDKLHHPVLPAKVIAVREIGLEGYTDQTEMSFGMFRALSLIIQLEYSIANNLSSCILIDDIGEGLDFNRSSKLIKLLIEKAEKYNIQLIMTTNDRFVMMNVDLDYWQIIAREDGQTVFYNKNNSKEAFEDFEFAGLNNSEFFFSEYYKGFK